MLYTANRNTEGEQSCSTEQEGKLEVFEEEKGKWGDLPGCQRELINLDSRR